jgi:hypothetical protein
VDRRFRAAEDLDHPKLAEPGMGGRTRTGLARRGAARAARIAAATNDAAARSALERFVRNFGDGHMDLTWPAAPNIARPKSPAAGSTCAELGYRSEPDSSAVASRLPGYRALAPHDMQERGS